MKEISRAAQLLNELSFTNAEIADFIWLKEVTIKKIRNGKRGTSLQSESNILDFLEHKVGIVQAQIVQYKRLLSKGE